MKVEILIELLKQFDGDLEVQVDTFETETMMEVTSDIEGVGIDNRSGKLVINGVPE